MIVNNGQKGNRSLKMSQDGRPFCCGEVIGVASFETVKQDGGI